mmetsp:Transcript_9439/g.10934  ORF Transcript_9439/g.10934 Transcript_9439/m.10934 type:complete len:221 (-) Transcript_9439:105-767(-)
MIAEYLQRLNKLNLVLASASPRRSELLQQLGLQFEVIVSDFDEKLDKSSFANAAEYARETATHKAIDVAGKAMKGGKDLPDIVIGSDTVVDLNGQVLEKPADDADAVRMLTSLSGSDHEVHTGVVIVLPKVPDPKTKQSPLVHSFSVTTRVKFAKLTDATIKAYVATKEPMGKAGAYGIQGMAGSFVSSINGCYFSVMGFPIHEFSAELAKMIEDGTLKC